MKFKSLTCIGVSILGVCAVLQAADKPSAAVKAKESAIREADGMGDYATVQSLLESMITDASLAPADRVAALVNYYGRARKKRGGDAAKTDTFIEAIAKLDGLPGDACGKLMQLRIDRAEHEGRKEIRETLLRDAVADRRIPVARRCELAFQLAVACLLRTDDIPGAVKIVEDLSKLPDLKEEDLFAACKAAGDLQRLVGNQREAVAAYQKIYALTQSDRYRYSAANLVHDCYLAFGEPRKAKEHFMQNGDPLGKAKMDRDFALKLLGDPQTAIGMKRDLFKLFGNNTSEDAAVRAKFADVARDRTLSMIATFRGRGNGTGAGNDNSLGVGSYEYALEILGYGEKSKDAKTLPYAMYKIEALAGLNRYAEVKKYTQEFRAIPNNPLSTETRYLLDLIDAVIDLPDKAGVAKAAIDKVDASCEQYKALAVLGEGDTPAKRSRSQHAAAPQATSRKGIALIELASMISHSRKNDLARDIYGLYEAMFASQPRKEGDVAFMDKPLLGISDFLAIKGNLKPYLLDRKFGGNLEYLAETDINAGASRVATGAAGGAAASFTAFYPVCDVNGFHVFFDTPDPDGKALAAGIASRSYRYELYFAPGWNQPYVGHGHGYGAKSSSWHYQTTYNNPTHRRFVENSPEFKHECLYYDKGFYAHYFFAWDNLYNKLPDTASDFYEFDTINWSADGGYAWSTRLNVHSRLEWGRLHFHLTKDQLKRIKQQIIFRAHQEYLAAKSQFNGPVDLWTDEVMGDPEFYQAKVKPLVDKLDAFLPVVSLTMSDADVDKVFQEAVPGWKELGYSVASLRARYLRGQLTAEE